MKRLNKKGFTLIELLAVIVVLAILMLVAVQNIFPMIANARANSFISTVENIRDSANNKYMSDMLTTISRGEKCYTVAQLVKQSYVSVDQNNIIGAVCVQEGTSGNSQYKLLIYDKANGYLYSTGLNGNATTDASPNYITGSASIDSVVAQHFFDVTQNQTVPATVFTENGMKSPTNVTNPYTAAGMPCYQKSSATGDNAVTKCFGSTVTIHANK